MYKDLDPILHSQLRLTIISHLVKHRETDFKELKSLSQANSGNVSIQINKLEKAGYITVTKGFKNNYQHTSIELTEQGLNAFEAYVKALQSYIEIGSGVEEDA
ncbi:MAG: transcriptional regulator [Bacteroidota bacterium]